MSRSPFHPGEREAQARAGFELARSGIRDFMAEQHRRFFAELPFLIAGGRGEHGPVATVLAGVPGFVSSPDPRTLRIAAAPAPGDPAWPALARGAPAGLLGIDLLTRRRNRANGIVVASGPEGLELEVLQSFGNCPQYIHPRQVQVSGAAPGPVERLEGLDAAARATVAAADTFFVATVARTGDPAGGVDVSHRGGPPGFVRLDGDVLAVPDYAGNRYFNTLGNLISEPRAGLLLVDLAGGDLLLLQGQAEIVWGGPEVRSLPGAERLWRVQVERGWRWPGPIIAAPSPT